MDKKFKESILELENLLNLYSSRSFVKTQWGVELSQIVNAMGFREKYLGGRFGGNPVLIEDAKCAQKFVSDENLRMNWQTEVKSKLENKLYERIASYLRTEKLADDLTLKSIKDRKPEFDELYNIYRQTESTFVMTKQFPYFSDSVKPMNLKIDMYNEILFYYGHFEDRVVNPLNGSNSIGVSKIQMMGIKSLLEERLNSIKYQVMERIEEVRTYILDSD